MCSFEAENLPPGGNSYVDNGFKRSRYVPYDEHLSSGVICFEATEYRN